MNWEELTGDEFPLAVTKAERVCLLPLSCLERHAHHLPLGTDLFIARETCRRAALDESVVVFPDLFLTQIFEARHCPGTIAIEADLILRILENVCREIARNGLDRIILVNAHGGNNHLLHFFVQCQLASPRDYVIYLAKPFLLAEDRGPLKEQWSSPIDGHAGENETSQLLAFRPDLVDQAKIVSNDEGKPQNRLSNVIDAGLFTGTWWYADHPSHYRGEAVHGSSQKGERMISARVRALVEAIRVVKRDTVTRQLQDEFFIASSFPSLG